MPDNDKPSSVPVPFTPFSRDAWEREKKSEVARDETGKFLPGTPSPNPKGRPRREIEHEAFSSFIAVFTVDEWQKAVRAMMLKAQNGDVAAFNTLRDMYAGKPTEKIAVTDDRENEVIELRFKNENANTIDIKSSATTSEPEAADNPEGEQ